MQGVKIVIQNGINYQFFVAILDMVQLIPPITMSNNMRVKITQTIKRPSVNYKFDLNQIGYTCESTRLSSAIGRNF
jgi:hypothetical protein